MCMMGDEVARIWVVKRGMTGGSDGNVISSGDTGNGNVGVDGECDGPGWRKGVWV